jgi:hypothetical protein
MDDLAEPHTTIISGQEQKENYMSSGGPETSAASEVSVSANSMLEARKSLEALYGRGSIKTALTKV